MKPNCESRSIVVVVRLRDSIGVVVVVAVERVAVDDAAIG